MRIVLHGSDREDAVAAASAAFERIAELDSIMSDYRADSEVMRVCEQAGEGSVEISSDLEFILRRSRELSEISDGAFDITIGPVTRLWRRARADGMLPDRRELARARERVGWQMVHLGDGTVELEKSGMLLDLGGIAKGYAADEAARILREAGIDSFLVDASGDIVAGERPPDRYSWTVSTPLGTRHALVNGAIATSGDTEQYLLVDGTRYSHIIDPSTGMGVTSRVMVTVVATNCMVADAVASIVSVTGAEDLEVPGVLAIEGTSLLERNLPVGD